MLGLMALVGGTGDVSCILLVFYLLYTCSILLMKRYKNEFIKILKDSKSGSDHGALWERPEPG
jgi:hypothetical protein